MRPLYIGSTKKRDSASPKTAFKFHTEEEYVDCTEHTHIFAAKDVMHNSKSGTSGVWFRKQKVGAEAHCDANIFVRMFDVPVNQLSRFPIREHFSLLRPGPLLYKDMHATPELLLTGATFTSSVLVTSVLLFINTSSMHMLLCVFLYFN